MRNAFSEALYESAIIDSKVCIVVADISPAGSMMKFQQEFPKRFINVGVAEQVMVGLAAGLAIKGWRPFTYTIATFSLYRPFEMVRDDICYQNLPVTVVGMGSGIIYSTLGGTHHTQEDVAIAGALPNMQILSPCDPLECIAATKYCALENAGPMYLRIGKAGEPILTKDSAEPFVFGRVRFLSRGNDICIISYGGIMKLAIDVANTLRSAGKSVSVVSCHTLKPLDVDGIKSILGAYKHVVIIEEHVPEGSLSMHAKQIAWDNVAKCKLDTFTLKDEFIHNYGTYEDLLAAHGISKELILNKINAF